MAHFCCFCHFLDKKRAKKMQFPMLQLLFHIIYGRKFVVYIKKMGESGCFVLVVCSPSEGSSANRSAIFIKMAKMNHIKIATFRKNFCHSLLLRHFDLFYFFSQFSAKKKCSIFLQFLMHLLIPSGTNFLTNIKYGVWGWEKKKQDSNAHYCLLPRRCPLCQYNANTKVQKRSLYLSNFLN